MTHVRGTNKTLGFKARRDCLWLKGKKSLYGGSIIWVGLKYLIMWKNDIQWEKVHE